jgi:hypothetical protein
MSLRAHSKDVTFFEIGFYLAFLDRSPRVSGFSPHPKSPVWIPMGLEPHALIFAVSHFVVDGHNAQLSKFFAGIPRPNGKDNFLRYDLTA